MFSSSLINFRNFGEPATFVLSPILIKLTLLVILNASRPLNRCEVCTSGRFLGLIVSTASDIFLI